MEIYSGLETPGRRDSLVSLAANMAWAGSVLAILMGQTQPKLASVSRNAHPSLPALWPNILLAQSRLLWGHCDSASCSRLPHIFLINCRGVQFRFKLCGYSTDLQDLVSLNNSVKLFHQIKNLSEEFSLYFDVSIRLIRLRLAHSRPRPARPVSPDCSRLR